MAQNPLILLSYNEKKRSCEPFCLLKSDICSRNVLKYSDLGGCVTDVTVKTIKLLSVRAYARVRNRTNGCIYYFYHHSLCQIPTSSFMSLIFHAIPRVSEKISDISEKTSDIFEKTSDVFEKTSDISEKTSDVSEKNCPTIK